MVGKIFLAVLPALTNAANTGEFDLQVAVKHVAMAADTMFSAVHMQMLRRCCRLDKVLLASLLLQTRTTGLRCLCAWKTDPGISMQESATQIPHCFPK